MGRGLSGKEAVILRVMRQRGQAYASQLVSDSDGELKPGAIYVQLSRMEDKGLVTSQAEQESDAAAHAGPARRFYRPTALGLEFLALDERARALLAGEVAR